MSQSNIATRTISTINGNSLEIVIDYGGYFPPPGPDPVQIDIWKTDISELSFITVDNVHVNQGDLFVSHTLSVIEHLSLDINGDLILDLPDSNNYSVDSQGDLIYTF